MYTYFKVQNFRCFQELEFNDLERVNLVAGMNNVGKTALLEALFLHCGAYNPALTMNLDKFRGREKLALMLGNWAEHPLSSLFYRFDVSKVIDLIGNDTVSGYRSLRLKASGTPLLPAIGKTQESEEAHESNVYILDESAINHIKDDFEGLLSSSEVAKVLELEYEVAGKNGTFRMIMDKEGAHLETLPPSPPFMAFFQSARVRVPFSKQATRYGNLEVRNEHDRVLDVLKIIEPRLKRLAVVSVSGDPMLNVDGDIDRLVPLHVMGGGMVRLADLAVDIGNAPNGVVIIDEVENGLHYSVLFKVWKAIALAARQSKTQIFATTHSWECIKAAHQAFTLDGKYDFRLHRLGWDNGQIKAVTYDKEALDAAIKAGLEVR